MFLEVMGIGVLITGESGDRQERAGAGAAVARPPPGRRRRRGALSRVGPDTVIGPLPARCCATSSRCAAWASSTYARCSARPRCAREKNLQLIVHLEPLSRRAHAARSTACRSTQRPARSSTSTSPRWRCPSAPGRNLAVLVEAAVRAYILRMRGIDPLQEFMQRQQRQHMTADPR
ncbi:MAG: hypothetical protein MZW92_09640 [Comamonadaceae bacterium]|nr:hypothetical protein [Comamonadaceae bacterium]